MYITRIYISILFLSSIHLIILRIGPDSAHQVQEHFPRPRLASTTSVPHTQFPHTYFSHINVYINTFMYIHIYTYIMCRTHARRKYEQRLEQGLVTGRASSKRRPVRDGDESTTSGQAPTQTPCRHRRTPCRGWRPRSPCRGCGPRSPTCN